MLTKEPQSSSFLRKPFIQIQIQLKPQLLHCQSLKSPWVRMNSIQWLCLKHIMHNVTTTVRNQGSLQSQWTVPGEHRLGLETHRWRCLQLQTGQVRHRWDSGETAVRHQWADQPLQVTLWTAPMRPAAWTHGRVIPKRYRKITEEHLGRFSNWRSRHHLHYLHVYAVTFLLVCLNRVDCKTTAT